MKQGDSTITARKELLEEERTKLIEKMRETLERLNFKISRYEAAEKMGVLNWDKE